MPGFKFAPEMTQKAFAIFIEHGITATWDPEREAWEVETRQGCKTCSSPEELFRLALEVLSGNA